MRPRSMTAAAVLATVLAGPVAGPEPVWAEVLPPGGGLAGGAIGPGGDPTAFAAEAASSGDVDGGGPGGAEAVEPTPCTWVTVDRAEAFDIYRADGRSLEGDAERWTVQRCDEAGGGFSMELFPQGEAVDPAVLAAQAAESVSVPDPVIATSPSPQDLVVRVPTWLWIDGAWWRPYSATATAGDVSATVTATPTSTSWSMGDGELVTCSGPGAAWSPGMPDEATDCSHTYTTSSGSDPSGRFPLSVTVELAVTWTSNVGASGTLPVLTRTAGTQVRVREIQAIETR